MRDETGGGKKIDLDIKLVPPQQQQQQQQEQLSPFLDLRSAGKNSGVVLVLEIFELCFAKKKSRRTCN